MKNLVGRFLEHARIAAFKNRDKWRVWAGSADAMARSFDRRLEFLFPTRDQEAKRKVLDILKKQLKDDVNLFTLTAEGQKPRWGGKNNAQSLD